MFNQATLIGRLGGDPELKHTQNDKAVANFSMATSKKYKDKDGDWQEKTTWNRVVVWGGSAEAVSKYLSKGSLVAVIGEVVTRSYENKDDEKVYTTEVVVSGFDGTKVIFLDKKEKDNDEDGDRRSSKSSSKSSSKDKEKSSSKKEEITDDDIPF